jgi:transposase InsO family protein
MELSGIDQLWVADLTYIRLREQFLYLAVILDAFSRRALGWALDDSRVALQQSSPPLPQLCLCSNQQPRSSSKLSERQPGNFLSVSIKGVTPPDTPLLSPCSDLRLMQSFSRSMCILESRSAILQAKILQIPCYFPC